ncbi:hypothetical protein ACFQV2_27375 [Actinokineospora soli]|uniref:Serine hydroxymethyltransferase-like domain-containing protein n=1 Tax=Actinokineospora soli TaxID=1048753 RepID=A0ABW2TSB4_9PSEU
MVTSGLRIGTPALATRGFDAEDFAEVADIIAVALRPDFDEATQQTLRDRVELLVKRRPLYPELG